MQIRHLAKFMVVLIFLIVPTIGFAASVTLRWQANSEPDISSYNVYYGTQSRDYGPPIPAGNTTSYTVENLTEGTTYYFAITASDTSGNESGYSYEVSANATSSEPATEDYQLLLSTNSDRSNAVKLSEQTISGNVYIFLDPEDYVSQVVFSIDGATHNTENYAPYDLGVPFDTTSLTNGAHTISARIEDQSGAFQTVSANCIVSNTNSGDTGSGSSTSPVQAVAIDANIASPVAEGQTVVLQATVEGGGANTEYRFRYRYQKNTVWGKRWTQWKLISDWSGTSSYNWDSLDTTGKCQFKVNARNPFDTSGWIATDTMSLTVQKNRPDSVNLNTNRTSPITAGTSVWLSANASGGTGSYEYKFMYRKRAGISYGKWNTLRDWSTSSGVSWNTIGLKGTFQLRVAVKNAGSEAKASADDRLTFKIN